MPSKVAVFLSVLLLFIRLGLAQVTTGTILGVVHDGTGAVVPGVSITARNLETGLTRTAVTSEQGRYQMPSLGLGNYEMQAAIEGFQTELRRGIELTLGREAVVDFVLQVGAVTQTLEVTGEAPLVETTSSSVSGVVESKQIVNLPLNGRSFDELALLQPAITTAKFQTRQLQGGFTTKMSIRGARPEQNSFLLDGTDVMGPTNQIPGGVGGQSFGVDTVREFRVETTTYSAQFGRATGGVINVVTKSGTNELRGSVFEFIRNSALDARNFFDPGDSPPAFRRNQFGASLGGPIRKDKTFFFGSYEGLREGLGLSLLATVPTAAARQGRIPNPRAAAGFDQITVNPAVKPYLDALYPLPNGRDFGDGSGEYVYSATRPTREDYFNVRGDHNFSSNDSLFGRFTFDDGIRDTPTSTGIFWEHTRSRNQFVTLQETHVFSSNLLNTARIGYNRTYTGLLPSIRGVSESTLASLAFVPGQPLLLSGSLLDPTPIEPIGNANAPRIWVWNLMEGSNDVTFTKGSHSLMMGALFKGILFVEREADNKAGEYDFGGLQDFLLGNPVRFRGLRPGGVADVGYRQNYFGWYVQDSIRVNQRLTLNLGLRHEFYTGPQERTKRTCNLMKPSDTVPVCGGPIYDTSVGTKNFGPRFGFAWDAFGNGKTAVRGGFGIFYDAMSPLWWQSSGNGSYLPFSDGELGNPPFPNAYALLASPSAGRAYLGVAGITANPSAMQSNLTVQHQIARDSVVTVGYVGSYGRHLWTRANENIVQPTILADGRKFFPANAPRRNPALADVRRVRTESNSTYQGLFATFQKRFGAGLQLQSSYTYAKSIDTGSNITNGSNVNKGATSLMDPDNWLRDRSLSDFDTRHIFSFNTLWELPFGRGKSFGAGLTGLPAKLVGGWQLGGIVKYATGSPMTVDDSSANWSRNGVTSRVERPDLVSGKTNSPVLGSPDRYFDPASFAVQTLGFYGTLGRNTLIGPNQIGTDVSLSKNTALPKVSEQFQVQFRAEFFNILNRTNFGAPSLRVFDSRGRVPGNAGRITDTSTSSRQIQFGLKIVW